MKINTILPLIRQWLDEDDLARNYFYTKSLSQDLVMMEIKIKSDLLLAGTDFFIAVFKELGESEDSFKELSQYEGKKLNKGEVIKLPHPVPFGVALTGERLALNLLHHASAIATHTNRFVELAAGTDIKVLDTRKTTPGLRMIEKYAVRVGGGYNHRFGQTDTWMVKDNHKTCLGGLEKAVSFFKSQGAFYNEIVVEIHNLSELEEAKKLGLKRLMLDNFSQEDIKLAVLSKTEGMTYEISGGINLENFKDYLIEGVDAISTSSLVSAPNVDISLKYNPKF